MNRRGFLGAILAACAAPAIVRADSLMRIVPTETLVASGPMTPGMSYQFASANLAFDPDEFTRQYIEPAMRALSERIDLGLYGAFKLTYDENRVLVRRVPFAESFA